MFAVLFMFLLCKFCYFMFLVCKFIYFLLLGRKNSRTVGVYPLCTQRGKFPWFCDVRAVPAPGSEGAWLRRKAVSLGVRDWLAGDDSEKSIFQAETGGWKWWGEGFHPFLGETELNTYFNISFFLFPFHNVEGRSLPLLT